MHNQPIYKPPISSSPDKHSLQQQATQQPHIEQIKPTNSNIIPSNQAYNPPSMLSSTQNNNSSKLSTSLEKSNHSNLKYQHPIKRFSGLKKAVIQACKQFSNFFTKLLKKSTEKNSQVSLKSKRNPIINKQSLPPHTYGKPSLDVKPKPMLSLKCLEYHSRTDGRSGNINRKDPNYKKYLLDEEHGCLTNQVLTECEQQVSKLETKVLSFAKKIENNSFNTGSRNSVANNHKILDKLDQLNIKIESIYAKLVRVPTDDKDRKELLQRINLLILKLNSGYENYIKKSLPSKDYLVRTQRSAINTYLSLYHLNVQRLESDYDQVMNDLSTLINTRLSFNKENRLVFDKKDTLFNFNIDPKKKLNENILKQMTAVKNNLLKQLDDIISSATGNKLHSASGIIKKQAEICKRKIENSYDEISKQPFCRATLHHKNQITKDFIEIPRFIEICKSACLDLIYRLPQLLVNKSSSPIEVDNKNSSSMTPKVKHLSNPFMSASRKCNEIIDKLKNELTLTSTQEQVNKLEKQYQLNIELAINSFFWSKDNIREQGIKISQKEVSILCKDQIDLLSIKQKILLQERKLLVSNEKIETSESYNSDTDEPSIISQQYEVTEIAPNTVDNKGGVTVISDSSTNENPSSDYRFRTIEC